MMKGQIDEHGPKIRRSRTSVHLLPLSKAPFQAPTDRDMLPSERREFVRTHRTCIFGYGRQSDGPAMSVVYYVPDDNDDLSWRPWATGPRPKPWPETAKSASAYWMRPGPSPTCRSIATP